MKFKKCLRSIKKFFSEAIAIFKKSDCEIQSADEQTLLCLEAAKLSIDHIVNF